jgi:hypothetical protein
MPYPIIGYVPSGEDYFGQEHLIESLWNRLEKNNILLTAPRRFGKTAALQDKSHEVRVRAASALGRNAPARPVDNFGKVMAVIRELKDKKPIQWSQFVVRTGLKSAFCSANLDKIRETLESAEINLPGRLSKPLPRCRFVLWRSPAGAAA